MTQSTTQTQSNDSGLTAAHVWGVIAAIVSAVITYYTLTGFHAFARGIGSPGVAVVALLGFWLLTFFVVILVAVMFENRVSFPWTAHDDAAGWAAYGAIAIATIVGAALITSWLGLDIIAVGPQLEETPYLSTAILGIVAINGYVFTGIEEADDADTTNEDQPAEQTVETPPNQSDARPPEEQRTHREMEPEESHSSPPAGEPANTAEARDAQDRELTFNWVHETDVSMDDVGGIRDVKRQLQEEIVGPLTTHRERADALGIPAPNVLFYGPPGTGKTFLAKALATELQLPFVKLSGSDVTSKWINESAQKIDRLFKEARILAAKEGGAVIFLDEIDAVLPERNSNSHEENRKVVNEFLTHLQDTDEHDIVFIAATNRRHQLDSAVVRNGRIDREIEIGLPDNDARRGILRAQLASRQHDLTEQELNEIVEGIEGATAADIAALVDDAARHAAFQRNEDQISLIDLQRAITKSME